MTTNNSAMWDDWILQRPARYQEPVLRILQLMQDKAGFIIPPRQASANEDDTLFGLFWGVENDEDTYLSVYVYLDVQGYEWFFRFRKTGEIGGEENCDMDKISDYFKIKLREFSEVKDKLN